MLSNVATYWVWLVVALVVGGGIGYWSTSLERPRKDLVPVWLWWVAAAFIAGLVVVFFAGLPEDQNFYLEMILLLPLSFVVGYLPGCLLRSAGVHAPIVTRSAAEQASLVATAPIERVRPVPAANAAEGKAAEEARQAAEAKAAEEARGAAEAKAAEEARRAAEAKAAEETQRAAEAKAAEETRRAAEAKAAEETRRAAEAKAAEETRRAAEAKAVEETRRAAATNAGQNARRGAAAEAAKVAERVADATPAENTRRPIADAKRAAQARAIQEARRAAGAKIADKARPPADEPQRVAEATADARIAKAPVAAAAHPGGKPAGMATPHDGKADDLKLIRGIGPRNEKICNDLGVFHFSQIAEWTSDETTWVDHHIAFPGRIEREHWIAQARLLAAGGDTEHSAAVRAGTITVDEASDAPLDAAAAVALGDSLPRPAPPVEGESRHPGRRPYGLAAAPGGKPDDLKRIKGIGPRNEQRLQALGIWRFAQIAAWTPDNVKWVGAYLSFPGRIDRERWIAQAKALATGTD
jgi:predicted flap endonuclease-1-like 5' DNA nuclease